MYLGLDIGTSAVKAVLIDERQRIVATASAPLTVSRPHPGWSEQSPDAWWRASVKALGELAAARPKQMAAVAGIGLSGQMHGATLLDAADRPLRPAILWNDARSSRAAVDQKKGRPQRRSKASFRAAALPVRSINPTRVPSTVTDRNCSASSFVPPLGWR